MQQLQEFKLLQHALILLGCIAFALFMLIDKGLLQLALLSDSSRLSGVIIIIYGAATLHWLWLCYQLSLEQQYINRWLNKAETQGNNQTSIHRLRESMSSSTSTDWDSDINLLADELTNRHALGHFAADTLIKLGLIGTVIGFIPMLLVAFGYRELNKAMPDAGSSFTWGTRAFGPYVGWMAGWVGG